MVVKNITGEQLRRIRRKQKLTLRRFADVVGFDPSQVWRMEKGLVPVSERMKLKLEVLKLK